MTKFPRPRHRDDFEIAIICALTVESDPVETLLDEEYEPDLYGKARGDRNTYTTGRIGNHYVVLVYLPGMGKASSATVACGVRFSFENIKLGILVGVCGGVPKTPSGTEILLGDVIISNLVVQGDFGRQYPNAFIRKDTLEDNLGRANPEIRSFIKRVSGQEVRKRLQNKIAAYSTTLYERSGYQEARYPGAENDKLYPPHYRHKHRDSNFCNICDQCIDQDDETCELALQSSCTELGCDDTLLIRRDRIADVRNHLIHIGRIASGDMVMKSGQRRDEIAVREGIIGFEMEGAGVWDSIPTVIIKSVCDYADSHKSKAWQSYAAITAAACMKAFLEEWRRSDRPLKRLISTEQSSESTKKRRLSPSPVEPSFKKKEKLDCLRSLSFPNIDSRLHDIASAHRNTCDWLFKTAHFQKWQNREDIESHNGVLWIKGKLGAGKSTLIKHALLYCKKSFSTHAIAAYFFNARGDNLEKTSTGMFRSLLYQLVEQNPQFLDNLVPYFVDKKKKHGNLWEWHPNQLESFLRQMMERRQCRPIFLFVDALDECDESEVRHVVSFLEDLSLSAVKSETLLNICLSSRHYPSVTMKKMLELVIEKQDEHDRDIAIYVQDKLRIRDITIERELIEKAAGIFMWVILVVGMLNQSFDEGRIVAMRRKLREVPGDLDEAFLMLLQKNNENKDETMLMLRWVLFTKRPLEAEELYFAVLAGTNGTESENLGHWDQSNVSTQIIERYITNTSRGLIELRKGDARTVQFIHESVNEFLIGKMRLRVLDSTLGPDVTSTSHDQLAISCLSYIKIIALDHRKVHGLLKDQLAQRYPFLKYSCTYSLCHAELACGECITQPTSLKKLLHASNIFKRLKIFHDYFETKKDMIYGTEAKLIYVVSLHNYQRLIKTVLFEPDIDVNVCGGFYGNALQAAIMSCSGSAIGGIKMLLDAGADVNAQGGHHGTALQAAIMRAYEDSSGSEDVIKMLLDAGADVNTKGWYHGGALQAAIMCFDTQTCKEVIEMLLHAGADVNAQGGQYGNALQAAAISATQWTISAKEVVKMLLDAGADVNAQGGHFGNALQAAACYADTAVVEMLLSAGANVDAIGGYYGSALQAAALRLSRDGYKDTTSLFSDSYAAGEIIKMFLDAGADVNIQGGHYSSALGIVADYACFDISKEVIKMLLDAGADVNAQGGVSGGMLHVPASHACFDISKEVIKILLDADADVNAQGGVSGGMLHVPASHAYKSVSNELTEMSLDFGSGNTQGGSCGSVLQSAAAHACTDVGKEVVKMLLNAGADVNAKGGRYGSALLAAVNVGHNSAGREVVKMLLDAGADLNAKGGPYGCALQAAAVQVYKSTAKELIKMLLDAGADVNAQGGCYGSALRAAATHSRHFISGREVVKMLLDHGATITNEVTQKLKDINISAGNRDS